MSKSYFVMISTDPEIDPRKCVVGIACAAQAVQDGHLVNVFFASHAVRLLQNDYITNIDGKVGEAAGTSSQFLKTLVTGAQAVHCSGGSQRVVGVTPENANEILVGGYKLNWAGPATVVSLSADADVVLTF